MQMRGLKLNDVVMALEEEGISSMSHIQTRTVTK